MNLKKLVEAILFGSRWLLVLFYAGLIVALVCYGIMYVKETWHLIQAVGVLSTSGVMLILLELVDMVMIANLVKMIITGSYHSFITKKHEFLEEKSSSGLLKVKLSTSLIGVSSIHMLQSFIAIKVTSWDIIHKQLVIHGIFLLGALALAYIDYLHQKGERLSIHEND